METTIVWILFGSFLLLLLIGAPITVSLGVSALAAFLYLEENPIKLVQIAFTSVGSFPLMALPAFILAGALMEAAGVSRRLVDIAETMTGPITGGLGMATVMACIFFGAISGSGPATTAAVGMLMIPKTIAYLENILSGQDPFASNSLSGFYGEVHRANCKRVDRNNLPWPWQSSQNCPQQPECV